MRTALRMLVAGIVVLSACSKKDEPKAGAKDTPAAGEVKGAAQLPGTVGAFLRDEKASLTPEMLEQLLLATASCQLKNDELDYSCQQLKDYDKGRGRRTALKDIAGAYSTLGAKHIGHEAPVVRILAARMMSSIFGTAAGSRKVLVEAAAKEQVPGVLAAFLDVVANSVGKDDEVHQLMMKQWDHPSMRVRRVPLSAYTSSWSKGRADGFTKVLEKLETEPEMRLRAMACERLAGQGDERAEAALTKYVKGKDVPDELFAACWRGAIAGWGGINKPDVPSKKLYDLSVGVLEAKPRTQKRPPWSGVSDFAYIKSFTNPQTSFDKTWKEKVQGWLKPERVTKALESIVTDEAAYWMARTSAVDALERAGVPDPTLQGFADKYKDAKTGDNWHIKNSVESALKRRASQPK